MLSESVVISVISGFVTLLVALIATRNKATQASVDALRRELAECKERNDRENNDRRRENEELTRLLKAAIEEKERLLNEKNRLLDENLSLMKKYIQRDTNPKIRKAAR